MTTYLKKYIERVSEVPAQLHRFFSLIRDLDERAADLDDQVESECLANLELKALAALDAGGAGTSAAAAGSGAPPAKRPKTEPAAAGGEGDASLDGRIAALWKHLVALSEEKVQVAGQVYDYVDSHIRQLDEDLRALEAQVAVDKARLQLGEDQSASDFLGGGRRGRGSAAAYEAPKRKYTKRKEGGGGKPGRKPGSASAAAAASAAMVPDAAEPRYCKCNGISYGSMIACENPDCVIEWFHVGCVGLNENAMPKGKWYCPDCAPQFQKPPAAPAGAAK